mmetsp:Transcript_65338/g.188197  ORF Transcript_65338/g.188197 Transcript_65338/m.188197 type:complete len:205 (-) Transcript_65338:668-1282(-)
MRQSRNAEAKASTSRIVSDAFMASSCWTKPMYRLNCRGASARPSAITRPCDRGKDSPARRLRRVVLPQPEGPSNAKGRRDSATPLTPSKIVRPEGSVAERPSQESVWASMAASEVGGGCCRASPSCSDISSSSSALACGDARHRNREQAATSTRDRYHWPRIGTKAASQTATQINASAKACAFTPLGSMSNCISQMSPRMSTLS